MRIRDAIPAALASEPNSIGYRSRYRGDCAPLPTRARRDAKVEVPGATTFYIWNWRTLWQTAARSVTEFADRYEQRCLAKLRMVRFGYALLALQTSISVSWLAWDFARHEIPAARFAFATGLLALLIAGFIR